MIVFNRKPAKLPVSFPFRYAIAEHVMLEPDLGHFLPGKAY